MNRGDSTYLSLNITISGIPITEDYADEIELTFNPQDSCYCVQKYLSKGDIIWNNVKQKYEAFLSQQDSFKLHSGDNHYQIRLLKNGSVVSSKFGAFILGNVNSKEVLVHE